jgi:hypothetical protein
VIQASARCRLAATPSRTGDIVQPTFPILAADTSRTDQEVVELPLLLPRWQAMELEAVARRRGMTTGQMIRRVIGELLAAQPATTSTH